MQQGPEPNKSLPRTASAGPGSNQFASASAAMESRASPTFPTGGVRSGERPINGALGQKQHVEPRPEQVLPALPSSWSRHFSPGPSEHQANPVGTDFSAGIAGAENKHAHWLPPVLCRRPSPPRRAPPDAPSLGADMAPQGRSRKHNFQIHLSSRRKCRRNRAPAQKLCPLHKNSLTERYFMQRLGPH